METNLKEFTEAAKVLIVDDEKDFSDILFRVVKQAGFTALVANDGTMALDMIHSGLPDIVLLDIRMPGTDGFDVIRQIKEREEYSDIPIIFISASTEVKQRVEGLKLGAVDFITKPIDHEELLVRVQTHLEMSRLRARLENQTADLQLANEKLRNEISERKRLETERLEIERKVLHAQKLESLGVMAGGIAHDFNNLLMVVLGNLGLALEDLPLDSEARQDVENAIQAAERSAELSRQMLIYTGSILNSPVALDLNEWLNRNSVLLKLGVSEQVTLNLAIGNALPPIRVDADQIQRLIMNILINASEAIGDKNGEVRLSTGVMDGNEGYLSHSRVEIKPEPGRFVFLDISDTGCGMDLETLRKVFDPFFTTKFTGRGLGLAEALGIVKGHRGALIVDSQIGKGTSVRVLFPALQEAQATSVQVTDIVETKVPGLDTINRRKTILLVDDETEVRNLTVRRLGVLGYDTITSVDGEDGVSVFRERLNEIDLVILDFTMPRMNGVEAFGELIRIKPDVKVILSSGYTEDVILQSFPDRRPASILRKPYDMNILKAELDRVLGANG
ncbi:MAG: response regulator [Desulfomonilaceae bacterium]|jgi:DNA-binding response OmpR family regulator